MNARAAIRLAVIALALCATGIVAWPLLGWYRVPNPLWGVLSGYYAYDPRLETPPAGLFRERIEHSLSFFLEATLKACEDHYPSGDSQRVTGYEIERIEYLGNTSYHAYALVHVRLAYASGNTRMAVFRLEAGHNESYMLASSTVNAGSWMAREGLVVPDGPAPPGWAQYPADGQATTCTEAGEPYGWRQ